MRLHLFVLLGLLALYGCSKPYRVAQVSGRVTLDGKPLQKASVTFAPLGTQENQAPGPTAWGPTDADGRYKLAFDKQTPRKAQTCRTSNSEAHIDRVVGIEQALPEYREEIGVNVWK